MTNIKTTSKIMGETLSHEHYFRSLLEQAYAVNILTETELEKLQFDCISLLAKRTRRYSGDENSSVPIEKAHSILDSIMFTLGVYLKSYQNPDDAALAVQSMGVQAVFDEGIKVTNKKLKLAKRHHSLLVEHLMQTKNVFYCATVKDGINGFFKLYDTEFGAHEIHITADYPVYNKAPQMIGVEFIIQYLKQISYENMFCTHFYYEDINYLMRSHDKNYENLVLNIYESVLTAALGCVLADAPANSLLITPDIQIFLSCLFKGKSNFEIVQLLSTAFLKLATNLSFSDGLIAYVQQSLPQLALSIESATKAKKLERIFIVTDNLEYNPKLKFSFGEKMDDEQYREILDQFISSQTMHVKIDILKNKIHSLADLEDLLLDAELNEKEMSAILKSLKPSEIVALMKKYSPAHEMGFTDIRDCEKLLCDGLYEFAAALPFTQQALLEKAVKSLELEEFE